MCTLLLRISPGCGRAIRPSDDGPLDTTGVRQMRLELTRRGDYAVRAMISLARPGTGQITAAVSYDGQQVSETVPFEVGP